MTNSQNPAEKTGVGFLCVQITTASGAIPVADASVTVRTEIEPTGGETAPGNPANEGTVRHLTSNQNGQTETISLPAPLRVVSLRPSRLPTYSTCDIEVVKEGYYRALYHNVPIYDTITSLQPVYLVPLSEDGLKKTFGEDERIYPESMNPALSSEAVQTKEESRQ